MFHNSAELIARAKSETMSEAVTTNVYSNTFQIESDSPADAPVLAGITITAPRREDTNWTIVHDLNPRDKKPAPTNLPKSSAAKEPSAATVTSNPLDQIHSFSRTLAKKHGWKAAVILQFLAAKIARSKHFIDGKRWYYDTVESLAERFPYIGKTTINDILTKLTKPGGPLLKGNYNKRSGDRTGWYAFADDFVRRSVSTKPVYFSVKDAVEFGVVEAVLLMNIAHWIKKNRKENPDYTWHRMSGNGMTKHLSFSKWVINRALEHLCKEGELEKRPVGGRCKEQEYRIVDETRLDGANPNIGGADPNLGGAKPEMAGANPGNYTYLEDPLSRHHVKRHSYLERPASPTAEGGSVFSNFPELNSSKAPAPSSADRPIPVQCPAAPATGKGSTDSLASHPASSTEVSTPPSAFQQLCDRNKSRSDEITPANLLVNLRGSAFRIVEDVINPTDNEILWQLIQISDKDELLKAVSTLLDNRQGERWPISEGEVYRGFVENLAREFFVVACVECRNRTNNLPIPSFELVRTLNRKLESHIHAEDVEQCQRVQNEVWSRQQERARKHLSPDKVKEGDATISAAEKVKVLKNSLIAKNRAGWGSDEGKLVSQVVEYTDRSLKAAHKFFQANPDVSVEHLSMILDDCAQIKFYHPITEGERDPLFWARRGTHLSFLLGHLDKIITQLDRGDQLPPITYLTKEELGLSKPDEQEAKDGIQ